MERAQRVTLGRAWGALALLLGGVHCARQPEGALDGTNQLLAWNEPRGAGGLEPAMPRSDKPVALAQRVVVSEDASVVFTLKATDPQGEALLYTVRVGPKHGTLFGTPPDLTYTPDADFHGTDSFTFTASDEGAESSPATVSIRVTPVNDAPVATSQAVTSEEGAAASFQLDVSDVDGNAFDLELTVRPLHGRVTGTPPHVTYTPDADFHGTDRFSYRVGDGSLASSEATVTLTVTPVSDTPVARSLTPSGPRDLGEAGG